MEKTLTQMEREYVDALTGIETKKPLRLPPSAPKARLMGLRVINMAEDPFEALLTGR